MGGTDQYRQEQDHTRTRPGRREALRGITAGVDAGTGHWGQKGAGGGRKKGECIQKGGTCKGRWPSSQNSCRLSPLLFQPAPQNLQPITAPAWKGTASPVQRPQGPHGREYMKERVNARLNERAGSCRRKTDVGSECRSLVINSDRSHLCTPR